MAEHFCILIVVMRLYEWFRHWNIVKQDVPFGGEGNERRRYRTSIIFFGIFCESVIIFVLIYKRNCYTCNDLDESLQHYPEWKKSISKGYILWEPTHNILETIKLQKWRMISDFLGIRDEIVGSGANAWERYSHWWNTHTQMSAGQTDKTWVRSAYRVHINLLAVICTDMPNMGKSQTHCAKWMNSIQKSISYGIPFI